MPEFKPKFSITAGSPQEAAVINQMFKHMAEKMDKSILLMAAQKINAQPQKKVKRLESGVLML